MCKRCYFLSLKIKREEKITEHFNWQHRAEHYMNLPLSGYQAEGDDKFSKIAVTAAEDYL